MKIFIQVFVGLFSMVMNGIYTSESSVNTLKILRLYTIFNLFNDLYYLPKKKSVLDITLLITVIVINILFLTNIHNAIELYNKNNCLMETIKKSKERWLLYVLTIVLIIKNNVNSFMEISSLVRAIILLCIQLSTFYLEAIIKKAERKKRC